ncbi:hypothetical protein MC885_008215 [Smutsia gigantea]|nr:hypothetical protein MC885_008215 [Smutsia gigantea]
MCLRDTIQHLENQVLLLLDDYKEMCLVPQGQGHPLITRYDSRDETFPFCKTVYILQKLFSNDMTCLQNSRAHWFQYPFHQSLDDEAVFKPYMERFSLKHKTAAKLLKATVSSCDELALRGLVRMSLQRQGVDEDEAIAMCLVSKFTAQRLKPVSQILTPAFQEFLA